MANEKRITDLFLKLVSFDSESYHEQEIGSYLTAKLKALGLQVDIRHTTEKAYLKSHPDSYPNIYACLKGTLPGTILFSAHLDTVSPGQGKKARITRDGFITSEGDTVLGADDISGLVAIIEALSMIRESKAQHPDLEILFTVSEEPFCEGSHYFNYDLLHADIGYVLDLTGEIGTAALRAPAILTFKAVVCGKASHAGFAPEEGINALKAAADAITHIKTGRIDSHTTVNIGTIVGGTANNIVPDLVTLTGEIRSTDHERALMKAREIGKILTDYTVKSKAELKYDVTEHIKAYQISPKDAVTERFKRACRKASIREATVTTFGGSDANRFNEAGIATIVTACGMERVHSTGEYTYIKDLVRSAELTFQLMTIQDSFKTSIE